jgi:hypothetical protein
MHIYPPGGVMSRVRITPRDAKLIIKYLDGVDDVITARMTAGFNPYEDHLTALLCEMLDEKQSALNALPYPLSALREDLELDPHKLKVSLTIEARKYPPNIEAKLTSSDLGVVVIYQDNIVPENSFEKGALFQAKRLYAANIHQPYNLEDKFNEFDTEQLMQLIRVAETNSMRSDYPHQIIPWRWYHNICYYLFYCPRPEGYEERSLEQLWNYIIPPFRDHWFSHHLHDGEDFLEVMHIYELVSDHERHIPGLLASKIEWLGEKYLAIENSEVRIRPKIPKPSIREAFEHLWTQVFPFSWFIIYRMLLGHEGSSEPAVIRLVRGQNTNSPILPRYVLTVRAEVGTRQG